MAISFSRYIDITSGVGGNAAVKQRDLITRIMTTSVLVPPQSYYEFETAAEVATVFGSTSEEYERAVDYFEFVSKQITSPDKISFARWVNVAAKPTAIGDASETATLANLNLITAGKLTISIGASTAVLTALNFTGAASLAAVATIIQTALVAVAGFSGSVVSYNATLGHFFIQGPTAGTAAGAVSFNPDPSNTVSTALGFLSPNTILAQGSDVETITQTLTNTAQASTNFATFLFTDIAALTEPQLVEAATWLQTQNINYAFLVPVSAANAAAYSAALLGFEGVFVTLAPLAAEYPEMIPGKIAAATNYANRNTSQNYMFQQDTTCTPSVTDDTDANTYDNLRINYYGVTQENGQLIAFYQTGIAMGGSTAPTDMNVFINEIWFRSDISSNIMSLLLSVGQVPTTARGRAMLLGVIQSSIDDALNNGVINVGQLLNTVQKQYIQNIAGDTGQAAQQVQTIGYWIDIGFSSTVGTNGATTWQGNYTVIYTKDNAIRKVVGTHVLI